MERVDIAATEVEKTDQASLYPTLKLLCLRFAIAISHSYNQIQRRPPRCEFESRPVQAALPEPTPQENRLEMKANLSCQRPRRHVVRAAKRRQKVVQGILVRQVDRRQLQTPLVPVALEEVVVADSKVKEAS
jgi:hypothetical protein